MIALRELENEYILIFRKGGKRFSEQMKKSEFGERVPSFGRKGIDGFQMCGS